MDRPATGTPRVRTYSPSRLAVFQECHRRYYYQYVIKVPRPRHAAQSMGISLHGALEDLQAAGGASAAGISGALAFLQSRWEKEGYASAAEEAAAQEQAAAMLKGYLERFGDGTGKPVLLEEKLQASHQNVTLLGIVDRVDRLPDGSLEVIDYKSGRPRDPGPAVKQQLAVYRHLVASRLGGPVATSLHYLVSQDRQTISLPEAEWHAWLDRAADTARAIEREETFDPAVGPACRTCDFTHRCQAYKRWNSRHPLHAEEASDL